MVRLCESSWAGFVPFLEYDAEIRGALHDDRDRVDQRNDTEGGEGIRHFPNGTAALECLYLVTKIS